MRRKSLIHVVPSLSGNIITIAVGWITSFLSNDKTKLYVNDQRLHSQIKDNDALPVLLNWKKNLAWSQI